MSSEKFIYLFKLSYLNGQINSHASPLLKREMKFSLDMCRRRWTRHPFVNISNACDTVKLLVEMQVERELHGNTVSHLQFTS